MQEGGMKKKMSSGAEKKWTDFLNSAGFVKNEHKLRLPSRFKSSVPWVKGVPSPVLPVKMMSNITVHDGWGNPHALKIAEKIISEHQDLSLRDLLEEMLAGKYSSEICYPYVWWVFPNHKRTRSMYEDALGMTFVKLGNLWQQVYPIHSMGALVGAQGTESYEDLPKGGYFVLWDNENQARKYNDSK